MADEKYVLITAASNEEATIGMTIRSVAAQTLPPQKWVIAVNESTDGTQLIAEREAQQNPFIETIYFRPGRSGNFGSKVRAINAGYERLANAEFDFVGILDADVTVEADYFQSLIGRLAGSPEIGIAGGVVAERCDGTFRVLDYNPSSVAGAVQMFRRACYEQIGGYVALEYGGIDAVAEAMARMKGWQTRTFQELVVDHHGKVGRSRSRSIVKTCFNMGRRNYFIGFHPLFFALKCLSKIKETPAVAGAFLMMAGYFWPLVLRRRRQVPDGFVRFLRAEQRERIYSAVNPLHKR